MVNPAPDQWSAALSQVRESVKILAGASGLTGSDCSLGQSSEGPPGIRSVMALSNKAPSSTSRNVFFCTVIAWWPLQGGLRSGIWSLSNICLDFSSLAFGE